MDVCRTCPESDAGETSGQVQSLARNSHLSIWQCSIVLNSGFSSRASALALHLSLVFKSQSCLRLKRYWRGLRSQEVAYCVAANCNNTQATQSITTHEFPRNRPAVRRKWVKFVQFKRTDFDAAPQSRPFVYRALRWVRFRKLYGGIPNGICFKAEFVGLSTW